ncbi:cytochrome P450 4c21-like isoform X2 [Anoplolepis gracilipes]|uniref:cytochrome P450 4c21-like isoform X2 n=1 Tax=Anoplolepis gracilipes TaxID=354296 RepID=UPI003BA17037
MFSMTFISVLLIVLACIAISYFILNYRQRASIKAVNTLPGPRTFPLIGSAYYFLRRSLDDFLAILVKLSEDYPSPFKFWIGRKLFITIYEPDQMKAILYNNLDKSTIYEFFESVMGKEGLITAPVSTWAKSRKVIAPSFNNNMLRNYFDIFVEQSLIMADKLEKIGLKENKVILYEHISKYALSTTFGTMTGMKDLSINEIDQCLDVAERVRKTFRSRMRNVFLYFNFIFNLTAMGREQRKNINFMHSLKDKIMQQKIYALKEQETKSNYETTPRTFLDILIEMSHKDIWPQEMINDHSITTFLAAFDTTTVTIDFVIFMLANFPEMQEKAYKELLEIYGTKTPKFAPIKYEDIQYMNFLDRSIKETMRIFPTIPIVGRHLTEDVKMGEFILPKGADVLLEIFVLHRNKKYWPNPLVFDPDRFLPEKKETYTSYFMPFSIGSRNCIGMNYAMISMKVVLATLIRTFVFKVDKTIAIDKIKLNADLALSPVEPLEVKIEKRDQN